MTIASPRMGVIIADDDPDIRTLVAMAATRSGLELIDELEDGDAAWEAIQSFLPELVVLDGAMPGKTGLEVTRLIRADPRVSGIRIIVISARADELSRRAALDAGADEYLVKPFSPRALVEHLATLAGEEVTH